MRQPERDWVLPWQHRRAAAADDVCFTWSVIRCRRVSRLAIALAGVVVLSTVTTACGGGESASEPASTSLQPTTSVTARETTTSTSNANSPFSLDVEAAAQPMTCEPPEGDSVRCTTTIENTTDQSGQIVTDVAFYDAADVRVETDSRFETYVAAGQRYVDEFFGPADTVRAEVLAVTWEYPEEPVTGGPIPGQSGGLYLPVDQAVRNVACQPAYDGGLECEIEIVNLADSTSEIDTTVAFFDGAGLRVSSDSRFQESVAAGEAFRQSFFGDAGAATAEVYEVFAADG